MEHENYQQVYRITNVELGYIYVKNLLESEKMMFYHYDVGLCLILFCTSLCKVKPMKVKLKNISNQNNILPRDLGIILAKNRNNSKIG